MSTVPVETLKMATNGSLRAVAAYDRDGIEVVFERDDVVQKETAIDRIHEELVLQEIGREYLENLFRVGRWHCTMHRFEQAICLHAANGEYSGVFVSVDTGADVNLERVADICHESGA
ncbi:hypothetical protein [Haloplanus aerogenes]|uniref:Uncharacterized protein n=2 Tax=Haloplanus aerogenes TaxID=660522 RepID=A0A3M0E7X4_9EURY|nr:hypothetical protein [Haloplanus aerogenes]RMB24003.1 hypothetical protein ATH50_1236 [Haloplanus aerogenes]